MNDKVAALLGALNRDIKKLQAAPAPRDGVDGAPGDPGPQGLSGRDSRSVDAGEVAALVHSQIRVPEDGAKFLT